MQTTNVGAVRVRMCVTAILLRICAAFATVCVCINARESARGFWPKPKPNTTSERACRIAHDGGSEESGEQTLFDSIMMALVFV